jgi:hypothetical protein
MTTNFYRVGSSVPRPTPNLEDQGISLSLVSPSKPVRHGWPYQQLRCCRHSFRVHWCTQAPSPSNKVLSTRWRYHRGGINTNSIHYLMIQVLSIVRIKYELYKIRNEFLLLYRTITIPIVLCSSIGPFHGEEFVSRS